MMKLSLRQSCPQQCRLKFDSTDSKHMSKNPNAVLYKLGERRHTFYPFRHLSRSKGQVENLPDGLKLHPYHDLSPCFSFERLHMCIPHFISSLWENAEFCRSLSESGLTKLLKYFFTKAYTEIYSNMQYIPVNFWQFLLRSF